MQEMVLHMDNHNFIILFNYSVYKCIIIYIIYILFPEYPWEHTTDMSRNLEQWLYLPDYANGPHAHKLIGE